MEIFKLFGSVFIDDKDAMKGLNDIDKKSENTGSNLGSMIGTAAKWGAGLAAGAGVAIGGLFALTEKVSESASQINDMSVRTGLSTDRLQELKFATGQVGVSFEAIDGAVGKLTKTMSGSDEGSKAAAAAFKELGIEAEDGGGHLRKMDDIFPEVIKKLAGMSNVTDRNALAFKFFGKGAMELVPLLDAGGDGIDAMSKQAHDLGLVLSKDAVNSADTFGDTLDQMKGALGGVVAKIGVGLMPTFQSMMDWVIAHMPQIQSAIQTSSDYIGKAISQVGEFINGTTNFFKKHWDVIEPILIGIAAGAASFYLVIGAMKAWQIITKAVTAVQLIFNAAMTANPIGLIIVAIGLLVAAGVYLYKNWDTVRLNVGKIFDSISYGVQSAMSFMKIKVLQGVDVVLSGFEKLLSWVPGMGKLISGARDKVSSLIDEEKVNQGTRTLEHGMNQATYAVALQEIELKKLETAGKDTTVVTQKLAAAKQAETVITKDNTEAIKKNEDAAKKLREENIKSLDALGKAIVDALKKRNAEQEKIETKALETSAKNSQKASDLKIKLIEKEGKEADKAAGKELDTQRKLSDEKIKLFDSEYNAKLKVLDAETYAAVRALEGQIGTIEDQTANEEKQLKVQAYNKEIADLKTKVTSAANAVELATFQKDLDDAIAKHEREMILDSRMAQKEALRDQIEAIKIAANDKKEVLKQDTENKKEAEKLALEATVTRLELEKTKVQESYASKVEAEKAHEIDIQAGYDRQKEALTLHFSALNDEEALQNEARKLAVTKNSSEIVSLLNTYTPGWQNAGQSYGQALLDGLNSKKTSIQSAVSNILSLVTQGSAASVTVPTPSSGSSSSSTSNSTPTSETTTPITSPLQVAAPTVDTSNLNLTNEQKYLKGLVENGTPGQAAWARNQADMYGLPGLKDGGNVVEGGRVMVGERGHEILDLPKGARVTPLDKPVAPIQININNPKFFNERDMSKMGQGLVNVLRGLGVSPS